MKFDLTQLKAISENKDYALYTLGQINKNLWKGVRVNKKTEEQDEVTIEKLPKVRVVQILTNNNQKVK